MLVLRLQVGLVGGGDVLDGCPLGQGLLRSVVEGVPADRAPASLIIQNEFTDGGREMLPLPLPLLGPSLRSVVGWDACAGRPDGVRRSTQVMGGDVRHRNRLARRQCSELRRLGHPARRGIRLESRTVCVTHPHLPADPGSTDTDGVAGPAVTWLAILEQRQHVLGAQQGPVGQQPVVIVGQSAPATDGDQPRITVLREDRHNPMPTIHEATRGVRNDEVRVGAIHSAECRGVVASAPMRRPRPDSRRDPGAV